MSLKSLGRDEIRDELRDDGQKFPTLSIVD